MKYAQITNSGPSPGTYIKCGRTVFLSSRKHMQDLDQSLHDHSHRLHSDLTMACKIKIILHVFVVGNTKQA